MARYRVFDPETAESLVPRITTADTIDLCNTGEYFSADAGEVILAPSVKHGDVLYIRIKSAGRASAPDRPPEPPRPQEPVRPQPEPIPEAVQPEAPKAAEPEVPQTPEPPREPPATTPQPKHFVASGFLGLDGEVEEETPEAPKPWWKRLID